MPRNASVEPARYGGLLHISRRHLAITAALFAGAASMTTISAVPAEAAQARTAVSAAALQSMTVPAEVVDPPVIRDSFGVTHFTVVNWPLAGGVAMSADFGPRNAPCAACSSDHEGIDWTPGAGTPVRAITDGVVVKATHAGAYGVHVEIQHVVDGGTYTSLAAHMQAGSLAVSVGDTVSAGQHIGNVGNTGTSTGTHLHFEIRDASGTAIDPYGWLAARVNS